MTATASLAVIHVESGGQETLVLIGPTSQQLQPEASNSQAGGQEMLVLIGPTAATAGL
jgi:hypothetical protein